MVEEVKVTENQTVCSKESQSGEKQSGDPDLLFKWRKSAALFQPSCKSRLSGEFSSKKIRNTWMQFDDINDRDVLDAAEALTYLARASAQKI